MSRLIKKQPKKNIHEKIKQIFRLSDQGSGQTKKNERFSRSDLKQMMGMGYGRFSSLLPYRYFDDEDELFINDESIGFGLELAPLAGANEEVIQCISDMVKNKLDHTISAQFLMFGSHQIGGLLNRVNHGYQGSDSVFKALGDSQNQYLKHAAIRSFHNKRNFSLPLRDYRCFLFISRRVGYSTSVAAKLCDLREDLMTELVNAGLFNEKMDSYYLLNLLRSITSISHNNVLAEPVQLDKYKELNEQILDPALNLKVYPEYLETANNNNNNEEGEGQEIVSLSLKELPESCTLWSQADTIANIAKPNTGIPCPFVISVHFKCEPQESSKLKAFRKASSLEKKAKSPYAKLIPGTVQAAEDWKKIRNDLADDSIQLCKVYYNCILFTDKENRKAHTSKAINAFRKNGMNVFPMKYQHLQSYLALFPFICEQGLWNDLNYLRRLNTMTTWNLCNMLPIVADFKGSQDGKGLFAPTFRNQAACIDNFSTSLDNYNVCICATSGSGKSVLSQTLISSVLAQQGKAWVIDLGGSYRKFCETLGGTYMDYSNLQLNPFSSVKDITRSAEPIRDLISVMASPNEGLGDVQRAYLLDAVNHAWLKKGNQANIDDIIGYLNELDQSDHHSDIRARDIVTLLKKFSPTLSQGISSKIFNDSSLLESENMQKERFVVLELGELESQPDLLKSVLFALILNIEEQMYGCDRNRKKICVIDEAWRLLSGSNQVAASFIEKGFRTARKHNGSFVTIVQRINDFYASSEAQAAWSCAETKIIMRQNAKSFLDFLNEKPDYFNAFEEMMIKNFKSSAESGYSEFMAQQGANASFHRLFLDPLSRVMYSSKAEDHASVQSYIDEGLSTYEAIQKVAEALYGGEIELIRKVGENG